MAARRSKKTGSRGNAGNLKGLALGLGVAAVLLIVLFRYLETPEGEIILFRLGSEGKFSATQEELGKRIVSSLEKLGVPASAVKTDAERDPSGLKVAAIDVEISPKASLIQANAALDDAARSIGAEVFSCEEKINGRAIEMTIGIRTLFTKKSFVLHRCYIKKGREPKKPVREAAAAIAIVVDDFGYFNSKLVREFLDLDIPITISVIPGLKHSKAVCRLAAEKGKDVICHLPMEPEKGASDTGDIPLVRVSMKGPDIERIVERALETTPGVIGMNNHMGSLATADRRVMESVLDVCRRKGLFFFDSLTSPNSVVREAARAAGVASMRNDLFLDNEKGTTRENMKKILSMARSRGDVAAVMHVKKESLEDLRWLAGEARREGVRFKSLSEMLGVKALAAKKGGGS